jgi:hypothetical protein
MASFPTSWKTAKVEPRTPAGRLYGDVHSSISLEIAQGAHDYERRALLEAIKKLIAETDSHDFGIRIQVMKVIKWK